MTFLVNYRFIEFNFLQFQLYDSILIKSFTKLDFIKFLFFKQFLNFSFKYNIKNTNFCNKLSYFNLYFFNLKYFSKFLYLGKFKTKFKTKFKDIYNKRYLYLIKYKFKGKYNKKYLYFIKCKFDILKKNIKSLKNRKLNIKVLDKKFLNVNKQLFKCEQKRKKSISKVNFLYYKLKAAGESGSNKFALKLSYQMYFLYLKFIFQKFNFFKFFLHNIEKRIKLNRLLFVLKTYLLLFKNNQEILKSNYQIFLQIRLFIKQIIKDRTFLFTMNLNLIRILNLRKFAKVFNPFFNNRFRIPRGNFYNSPYFKKYLSHTYCNKWKYKKYKRFKKKQKFYTPKMDPNYVYKYKCSYHNYKYYNYTTFDLKNFIDPTPFDNRPILDPRPIALIKEINKKLNKNLSKRTIKKNKIYAKLNKKLKKKLNLDYKTNNLSNFKQKSGFQNNINKTYYSTRVSNLKKKKYITRSNFILKIQNFVYERLTKYTKIGLFIVFSCIKKFMASKFFRKRHGYANYTKLKEVKALTFVNFKPIVFIDTKELSVWYNNVSLKNYIVKHYFLNLNLKYDFKLKPIHVFSYDGSFKLFWGFQNFKNLFNTKKINSYLIDFNLNSPLKNSFKFIKFFNCFRLYYNLYNFYYFNFYNEVSRFSFFKLCNLDINLNFIYNRSSKFISRLHEEGTRGVFIGQGSFSGQIRSYYTFYHLNVYGCNWLIFKNHFWNFESNKKSFEIFNYLSKSLQFFLYSLKYFSNEHQLKFFNNFLDFSFLKYFLKKFLMFITKFFYFLTQSFISLFKDILFKDLFYYPYSSIPLFPPFMRYNSKIVRNDIFYKTMKNFKHFFFYIYLNFRLLKFSFYISYIYKIRLNFLIKYKYHLSFIKYYKFLNNSLNKLCITFYLNFFKRDLGLPFLNSFEFLSLIQEYHQVYFNFKFLKNNTNNNIVFEDPFENFYFIKNRFKGNLYDKLFLNFLKSFKNLNIRFLNRFTYKFVFKFLTYRKLFLNQNSNLNFINNLIFSNSLLIKLNLYRNYLQEFYNKNFFLNIMLFSCISNNDNYYLKFFHLSSIFSNYILYFLFKFSIPDQQNLSSRLLNPSLQNFVLMFSNSKNFFNKLNIYGANSFVIFNKNFYNQLLLNSLFFNFKKNKIINLFFLKLKKIQNLKIKRINFPYYLRKFLKLFNRTNYLKFKHFIFNKNIVSRLIKNILKKSVHKKIFKILIKENFCFRLKFFKNEIYKTKKKYKIKKIYKNKKNI